MCTAILLQSRYILMEILHSKHEAVFSIIVCLDHLGPLLQQMGDTFGVSIFSSKKKWRFLQVTVMEYHKCQGDHMLKSCEYHHLSGHTPDKITGQDHICTY